MVKASENSAVDMNKDDELSQENKSQGKVRGRQVRILKNTAKSTTSKKKTATSNKKKATVKSQAPTAPKKRGRPAGSGVKNKMAKTAAKRGPGRPATKTKTVVKQSNKNVGRPTMKKAAKAGISVAPGKQSQQIMSQFWKDVELAAKNARKALRGNNGSSKKAKNG